MSSTQDEYNELARLLGALLDSDPAEAVRQARKVDYEARDCVNLKGLRAAILVDGGTLAKQLDAVEEGVALFRSLHSKFPTASVTFNLANGLTALVGPPPRSSHWLDHQEKAYDIRAGARKHYWSVAHDCEADLSLRTQAWTNLANQFRDSYRLSEAHDAWLAALALDPENGVAAACAASNLLWLHERGTCSDLTRIEALMLARVANRNQDKVIQFAGIDAAEKIAAFAQELPDPPAKHSHADPFLRWVEHERLTLSPSVELVDSSMGKLDWLTLPGILERDSNSRGMPPPLFAMFNMLKGDFLVARDLAWRAISGELWPNTGRFANTLDFAMYGPEISALVLAHRTALDLLDKVAVTANHYFNFGVQPSKVFFGKLWRRPVDKKTGARPLFDEVEKAIRAGAHALYGLVELADDYDIDTGILRSQKDLRNAGTHRFVVLHDFGDPIQSRQAPEIERHLRDQFAEEAVKALRVARSAIQMLTFSIAQHEQGLQERRGGLMGTLAVHDYEKVGTVPDTFGDSSGDAENSDQPFRTQ